MLMRKIQCRGVLHQHPAQRRAEQRADLARQGDEGHRRHILIARDDLHHRQAADRHHHRAADSLQHPRHHQLVEGAGLAQNSDPAVNSTMAVKKILRTPTRSASQPLAGSITATVNT